MFAGPMTLLDHPHHTEIRIVVKCKGCDWELRHRDVMQGLCPRCGRYVPV